jgi:hypothetical protein
LESNLKHVQTDSTPNLIWNLAAAAMALQRQAMAMAKKKILSALRASQLFP